MKEKVNLSKLLKLYGFEKNKTVKFLGKKLKIYDFYDEWLYGPYLINNPPLFYRGLLRVSYEYFVFNIGNVPSYIVITLHVKNDSEYKLELNIKINDVYLETFEVDVKMLNIYKDVLNKKIPFGIFFDYLRDISTKEIRRM